MPIKYLPNNKQTGIWKNKKNTEKIEPEKAQHNETENVVTENTGNTTSKQTNIHNNNNNNNRQKVDTLKRVCMFDTKVRKEQKKYESNAIRIWISLSDTLSVTSIIGIH